jgi:hypothetical protein
MLLVLAILFHEWCRINSVSIGVEVSERVSGVAK